MSIGGRDDTAHAILQDGGIYHTQLSMKRDLARQLAKLLYGPVIRLHGNGRFERQSNGIWKMSDFRVERYEPLNDATIAEMLVAVRAIPGNGLMDADAYRTIAAFDTEGGDSD